MPSSSVNAQLKQLRLTAALGLPAYQAMALITAQVERLIGCSFANFFWLDGEGRPCDAYLRDYLPEAMDAFVGNHAALERDPREPTLDKYAALPPRVGAGRMLIEGPEFRRTLVYNDVFRPYRIEGSLELVVREPSGRARGILMVNRSTNRQTWTRREAAILAAIHDHVLAALAGPAVKPDVACSATMDDSAHLLVDGGGQIEYSAGNAITLAMQHADLAFSPDFDFSALGQKLTPALHALLDRAATIRRGLPSPPAHEVRRTRHGEITARVLHCNPGPAGEWKSCGPSDERYMVCLERRPPLAAIVLGNAAALPLSAREQELAVFLALGLSSTEAAERMAISLTTLRTYLKSVYNRTDVAGRSGLLALLRGGSPPAA
ncbi:helix-turn-helix transcriptional regulator [Novosphingobium sp.]|uniref:helix-turn-helix transcriptional regulator n=1 Tax=Novosphingobium sp. TaxID=1874826 RepID=UPI00262E92CF|nr:helix-turn-helix transcriptional regulator [Novosphingobium sp.]